MGRILLLMGARWCFRDGNKGGDGKFYAWELELCGAVGYGPSERLRDTHKRG